MVQEKTQPLLGIQWSTQLDVSSVSHQIAPADNNANRAHFTPFSMTKFYQEKLTSTRLPTKKLPGLMGKSLRILIRPYLRRYSFVMFTKKCRSIARSNVPKIKVTTWPPNASYTDWAKAISLLNVRPEVIWRGKHFALTRPWNCSPYFFVNNIYTHKLRNRFPIMSVYAYWFLHDDEAFHREYYVLHKQGFFSYRGPNVIHTIHTDLG